MKKLILITSIIAFVTTSCTFADLEKLEPTFKLVKDLAEIQSQLDDALTISEDALTVQQNGETGYLVGKCAFVTNDTVNSILTLNMGSGCTGLADVERKGKIIIDYDGKALSEDYTLSITFKNYSVNGHSINGTYTVNTIHRNEKGNLEFSDKIEDAKITFADGRWFTWDAERIREMTYGENTPNNTKDDIFQITGFTDGNNSDGGFFTTKITKPITFSRACFEAKNIYPSLGATEITMSGQPKRKVDWGLGFCNSVVNIFEKNKWYIFDLK